MIPPPRGTAYLKLALVLGGLTAMGPLAIDTYLPALPTIARELSTTRSAGAGESQRLLRGDRARPGGLWPAVGSTRAQAGVVFRAVALHPGVGGLCSGHQRRVVDCLSIPSGARWMRAARGPTSRRPRPFRSARLGPDAFRAHARDGTRADTRSPRWRSVAGAIRVALHLLGARGIRLNLASGRGPQPSRKLRAPIDDVASH